MSRSKHKFYAWGSRWEMLRRLRLCFFMLYRLMIQSIDLSVNQSIRFICWVSSAFICMLNQHQLLPGLFPYSWADGLIFWRMFDAICSQHSPSAVSTLHLQSAVVNCSQHSPSAVSTRELWVTRQWQSERDGTLALLALFPNLIISTVEVGQFTFLPLCSQ
jgi:hypothetical protein